ncbi:MAG: addiction module protein [Bacteroidia bacterium]|nr:addiction module protein [Bacteroidia bacterium]
MSALQEQILQLSVADRLQLIAFIASSISPEAVQSAAFEVPDTWVEEALARDAAYAEGNGRGLTWEEVNRQVRGGK